MSKKIELNELDSVTGGTLSYTEQKIFFQLTYKETADGVDKERFWGLYTMNEKGAQIQAAKKWCEEKRFTFVKLASLNE